MSSNQLRPRNAYFSLLSPILPWIVSSGLLLGGCSSQDWTMGLGSQDEPGEPGDSSQLSPDKTKLPKPDASKKSTDPTTEDSQNNSPDSNETGDPADTTQQEEESSTSGGTPTTSTEDPGPETSVPEPELDSSTQDSDSSGPDPEPDADDEPQDPSLPACGDGLVQGDEECDDGNKIDTDACLSNCRRARCGDWIVWKGHEECDPGPDGDTVQSTTCAAVCGQFSELIVDASSPSRICYASGSRACQGGPWDCRGCKDPNQ